MSYKFRRFLNIWLALSLFIAQGDRAYAVDERYEGGLPVLKDLKPVPPPKVHAENWSEFSKTIEELRSKQKSEGVAYMVSGFLVLVGGGFGYANSTDSLQKVAFSLSQSLGIGALGYGYYSYKIGGGDRTFYDSVAGVSSLNEIQKDELTRSYFKVRQDNLKTNEWIRFVTHSLIAGLNLVYASQESNADVRSALYFVGGVNAMAAISIAF